MNIRENLKFKVKSVRIWVLVLSLLLLSQSVLATDSTEVGYIQLNVKNTNINPFFEVRMGEDGMVYLPVLATLEYLELYLFHVNWIEGWLDGTIPSDQSIYRFNWKESKMQKGAKGFPITPQDFFLEKKEIYLAYPILQEWLPLEVRWDAFSLEIFIDPDYKLVSELSKERQEMREQIQSQAQKKVEERKVVQNQQKFFAPGIVNYQLGMMANLQLTDSLQKSHKSPIQSLWPQLTLRYSGPVLYGDFVSQLEAKLTGELGLKTIRLSYRDLPYFQELGLGDGLLRISSLLRNSAVVRGLTFKSQDQSFDGMTTIRGKAPTGSVVDLYWRGVLIDYQKVEEDDYLFQEVPVLGEYNIYELFIYTPDGQVETRKEYVIASAKQQAEGNLFYQGGLGVYDDKFLLSSMADYGVDPRLTVGGSVTAFTTGEDDTTLEKFVGANLLYQILPELLLSGQVQVGLDQGGVVYQSGFQSYNSNWLFLGHLKGYQGVRLPIQERYQQKYLTQEGMLQIKKSSNQHQGSFTYRLTNFEGAIRQKFLGVYHYQMDFATSFSLENALIFGPEGWQNQIGGEVTIKETGLGHLEGKLQLDLSRAGLDSYSLMANYQSEKGTDPWSYSLGLGIVDHKVFYMLSGEMQLGEWLLLKGSLSNQTIGFSLNLQETRHLVYPFRKLKGDSLNKGLVSGRVYLDTNGNGQRDDGEKGFTGVRLLLDDYLSATTDQQGRYLIEGVIPDQPMKLRLDMSTLDLMYSPEDEKKWVQTRPGDQVQVDFAVLPHFGISGQLRGLSFTEMEKLSKKVRVVLYDQNGEKVKSCIPEYDGFYIIDQILPGRYHLTVEFLGANDGYSIIPLESVVVFSYDELPRWHDGFDFQVKKEELF